MNAFGASFIALFSRRDSQRRPGARFAQPDPSPGAAQPSGPCPATAWESRESSRCGRMVCGTCFQD